MLVFMDGVFTYAASFAERSKHLNFALMINAKTELDLASASER